MEHICEEVVIIDHGRIVATGDVDLLRRSSHKADRAPARRSTDGLAAPIAGVELVERRVDGLRLLAERDVDPEQVLEEAQRVARVVAFSYGPPSLAELFLELVKS